MKEERGYKAALHMGPNPVWERGDCHEAGSEVPAQLEGRCKLSRKRAKNFQVEGRTHAKGLIQE